MYGFGSGLVWVVLAVFSTAIFLKITANCLAKAGDCSSFICRWIVLEVRPAQVGLFQRSGEWARSALNTTAAARRTATWPSVSAGQTSSGSRLAGCDLY